MDFLIPVLAKQSQSVCGKHLKSNKVGKSPLKVVYESPQEGSSGGDLTGMSSHLEVLTL